MLKLKGIFHTKFAESKVKKAAQNAFGRQRSGIPSFLAFFSSSLSPALTKPA